MLPMNYLMVLCVEEGSLVVVQSKEPNSYMKKTYNHQKWGQ